MVKIMGIQVALLSINGFPAKMVVNTLESGARIIMTKKQKALFVIFGGTGDLARRKLYPSLFKLYRKGFLDDDFAVIGTARREWTDDHYREVVLDSIRKLVPATIDPDEFTSHFYYQAHNVNDTQHYVTLRQLAERLDEQYQLGGNRIFYMAMSPKFFSVIAKHLKTQGLVTPEGYNRLVIEKPFGNDLGSARKLNDDLRKYFPEESIFRIDHYLGKEMIQNISALRFGNNLFNALWNNRYIDNIQITLCEPLGVGTRAGYYEGAGALRDMFQNHVLQIVSLLTMNSPASFTDEDIRREKMSALKALKFYSADEIKQNIVRGQYDAANGMKGYREENGVDEYSGTETFVAGKLIVDNMSFAGVPIYFRTGKRMRCKQSRVDVVFKNLPARIFKYGEIRQNVLSIEADPHSRMSLQLNTKKEGQGFAIRPINLEFKANENEIPGAYEKLLLDVLYGNAMNFTHLEELLYSWQFVDAIERVWDDEGTPADFPNYDCGTMGPRSAMELLARDGKFWVYDPE